MGHPVQEQIVELQLSSNYNCSMITIHISFTFRGDYKALMPSQFHTVSEVLIYI